MTFLRTQEGYSVSVSSDATADDGGEFRNAGELFQHQLDLAKSDLESQILKQTKVRLGQADAEELIHSYRLKFTDSHRGGEVDRMVISRDLVAGYKGRIYNIALLVDADKYDNVKGDFEHLITTFRFLE